MMDKNTHFPQYRKLSNGKTFYKIVDERTFEEIVLMGEKRMYFKTVADKYPEMLRIKDMLELERPPIASHPCAKETNGRNNSRPIIRFSMC